MIAHDYWSSHPDEDPNARRLRRYSAGHSPSSSSAVTQESLVASRPCSRGSICSDQIISAHYDEFARPGSRGSVGLSVGSGDGSRPSSRGTHISGGGILRPPSRGGVGLQDEMRPSSGGSVAFNEKIRHRPGSSRTGSVYDSESRPETSGRDAGTLLLGSRPASRANVRFTDGSRPGSAMILGQSKGLDRPASVQRHETAGFDRPESINTFALPEVPSPRSSDSEIEEVLEGENR